MPPVRVPLAVALFLVACAAPPPVAQATSAPAAPSDWTPITRRTPTTSEYAKVVTRGFRISLPPGWTESASLGSFTTAAPGTAAGLSTATPQVPALSLLAGSRLTTGHALSTSVTVSVQHHPDESLTTGEMAGSMERFRRTNMNAVLVLRQDVVMRDLTWAFLQMKFDLNAPGLPRETYSTIQFIRVASADVYIIEFTTPLEGTEERLPNFRSIAETFTSL